MHLVVIPVPSGARPGARADFLPMTPVLLNVDVGELPSEPEAFYSRAHLVHVACGGHAGDEVTMRLACERAQRNGCRLGAHPSYPDRENFGRKSLDIAPDALMASLARQLATLAQVASRVGVPLASVKAHGALYHDLSTPERVMAYLDVVENELGTGTSLVGPPSGEMARAAKARGFTYLREGFADRGKTSDGSLLPRSHPDALIRDPAACVAEALHLARSGRFDTLCLHGDTLGAEVLIDRVRQALDELPT